jgi:hypothetical protein
VNIQECGLFEEPGRINRFFEIKALEHFTMCPDVDTNNSRRRPVLNAVSFFCGGEKWAWNGRTKWCKSMRQDPALEGHLSRNLYHGSIHRNDVVLMSLIMI